MENIKVLVASDSFKGSATSMEVADSIEKGILKFNSEIEVIKYSIADGGEGTLETIIDQNNGEYVDLKVTGPLKEKVNARYGIVKNKVFIEMAQSSGLGLVNKTDRNPLFTHTYGVGEMINDALSKGYKDIYIGLGGSATNDGGMGMAKALGVKFLDKDSKEIQLGAIGLEKLDKVDVSGLNQLVKQAQFTILSDVTNPLCGENGASFIFSPQKGADEEMVKKLDRILEHYGKKVEELYGQKFSHIQGSGAAGGLGFGVLAFCKGRITSGIDTVINLVGIKNVIQDVDLVITGEGNMDNQSIKGKAPIGIGKASKSYNKPVIAIVGGRSNNIDEVYKNGIDLVIDIVNRPMELDFAMENAKELISSAGETAIRAYCLVK